MPEFLTTKEVAALLRIKERKVYDLVADNAIPVSRVTGKLLFPRELVESWVLGHTEYGPGVDLLSERPTVMAGSHDPLLEWALRESGSEIASFFDGSLDGLTRLAAGRCLGAGVHLYDADAGTWNERHARDLLTALPVVLIGWAWRTQGLVLSERRANNVSGLGDLAGATFIARQSGAGSRVLLDHLLREAALPEDGLDIVKPPARSEAEVALAVLEGRADAGLAVETVARQYRLAFVPLMRERYDIAVWRRDYFEPPLQRLLAFCRSNAFAARAREFAGYDLSELGAVRYNGA